MAAHNQPVRTNQGGLLLEADLLGPEPSEEGLSMLHDHAVVTAPVLTGDTLQALGAEAFPQTALYGRVISQHGNDLDPKTLDPRVFVNTNAPFSALVCGVQGSGKSHSTSVLLESVLIPDPRLGQLPEPLSALVFHLDTAAGGGMVQPCEAAYLAAVDLAHFGDIAAPTVKILVLPTNLNVMRKVYKGIPGVVVEPLHFSPQDISGERLLAMMKVDDSTQMPLYMEAIMNILRQMSDHFDYNYFRREIQAQKFNSSQNAMLKLRLSLLDSCLNGGTPENSILTHFKQGQLTIIDLSSPFMDGSSACGFFDIILGLFVEADIGSTGKIVVLDEAHKYLSDKGSSSRLSESLLTVVRQQRHLATRVIISTQEPTVVPETFIDLCSFVIAHRFSSPTWLKHLTAHTSSSSKVFDDLWNTILSLGTGQGVLFAPGCLCVKTRQTEVSLAHPSPLGHGYLVVRSRIRVTQDGGHSLLAVSNSAHATRLPRVRQAVTQDTLGQTAPIIVSSSTNRPSDLAPETHAKIAAVGGDAPPQHPPSNSAASTSAYLSIVKTVAKIHENGYSSASLGHLVLKLVSKQGKKPFRIYGELEAAISLGISDGELELVEIEQGGSWFMLPETSQYRSPHEKDCILRPVAGQPGQWDRLVEYLKTPGRVVLQTRACEHFCSIVPDAPYGRRKRDFTKSLARARAEGIVTLGGEGVHAWVKLVEPDLQ